MCKSAINPCMYCPGVGAGESRSIRLADPLVEPLAGEVPGLMAPPSVLLAGEECAAKAPMPPPSRLLAGEGCAIEWGLGMMPPVVVVGVWEDEVEGPALVWVVEPEPPADLVSCLYVTLVV